MTDTAIRSHVTMLIHTALILFCHIDSAYAQTYEEGMQLFNDLYSSSNYNRNLRPLNNLSEPLVVNVRFFPVSLVKVDDVSQSFLINGFLGFTWRDQRATWNPTDFGGVPGLHPEPTQIWRPKVILMNTVEDRDVFQDEDGPIFVFHDGTTIWNPGNLIKASCPLKMDKYPFDKQNCNLQFCPMKYTEDQLVFQSSGAEWAFFALNGEWNVNDVKVIAQTIRPAEDTLLSCVNVNFHLERRPMSPIVSILLPVIMLSFLSMMVTLLPVECGEKVSYGITVLLSLSVFMSFVSNMLPRTAESLPAVVIYLFLMLVISDASVLVSIISVHLHFKSEKEDTANNEKKRSPRDSLDVDHIDLSHFMLSSKNRTQTGRNTGDTRAQSTHSMAIPGSRYGHLSVPFQAQEDRDIKTKDYRKIGQRLDKIAFVVFLLMWISLTCWFFITVMT